MGDKSILSSQDYAGLYEFHGHSCPMSTMGARIGAAAMAALGVTKHDQFLIEGRFSTRNCALDGIQFTTGCTLGNGNLSFEDEGKAVFVLRRRDGGRSVTVAVSEGAIERLAAHKKKKAGLLEERDISGLARSMEIDLEIKNDFERLIQWVREAPEGELLHVSGGGG